MVVCQCMFPAVSPANWALSTMSEMEQSPCCVCSFIRILLAMMSPYTPMFVELSPNISSYCPTVIFGKCDCGYATFFLQQGLQLVTSSLKPSIHCAIFGPNCNQFSHHVTISESCRISGLLCILVVLSMRGYER